MPAAVEDAASARRLRAPRLSDEQADTEAYATGWAKVKAADGVLVPGGFGDRGIEGKIAAARYGKDDRRTKRIAEVLESVQQHVVAAPAAA